MNRFRAPSPQPACAALAVLASLIAVVVFVQPAFAQGRPDPAVALAAQRAAMSRLSFMDGIWRGPAWTILPSGEKHTLTQTERVGPFLDGAIRVIEGRGYDADGKLGFNAFGTISYDHPTASYRMHSYAQGNSGDFALTVQEHGFTWEIPAGPATIRYTATIHDGTWTEFGDRIVPEQEPVRFYEMHLLRVGDTDWPAAGAVGMK
jgi:hypothetical protein